MNDPLSCDLRLIHIHNILEMYVRRRTLLPHVTYFDNNDQRRLKQRRIRFGV